MELCPTCAPFRGHQGRKHTPLCAHRSVGTAVSLGQEGVAMVVGMGWAEPGVRLRMVEQLSAAARRHLEV